MKNETTNKGYNISIITVGICVVLALTYLIPQTLHEHQIEEERMERLERTIDRLNKDFDDLENKMIDLEDGKIDDKVPH